MKKIYFFILLSLVLFSCNMNEAPKEVDKTMLNLVTLEISVEGMTCEGCENTVQTELLKLDGVGDVKASHVDKLVIVNVDTTVNKVKDLEYSIERVGYSIIKE